MITVVDYGVNNIRNVVRAFAAGGHAATLTADPEVVRAAERVLLPGVGHFGRGSSALAESGLGDALRDVAAAGRPVMGICLGLQLFFRTSEEAPDAEGLGLLEGRIRRFSDALPVPHLGWDEVTIAPHGAAHPVLAGFAGAPQYFYHVHSYHPTELPEQSVLGECDYGGRFPAIVGQDNVVGAQFHPEKSQRAGIALLDAFARWDP